jgi:hypothetical protein
MLPYNSGHIFRINIYLANKIAATSMEARVYFLEIY